MIEEENGTKRNEKPEETKIEVGGWGKYNSVIFLIS